MADCWISPIGYVKELGKCILIECLWPPIKCHIDYWWHFDNNIQGLRDGIRYLDRETFDINQKIEEARLRTETLRPGVEEWSKAGSEKLVEARRILPDDNIPKVWNLISRYSIGRSAKKTAEEIVNLRNDGIFSRISDPAPPPSMASTSYRQIMDFESRKQIEEEIIESLRNSSVSMIGICGMGGVGKTTMVEKIRKRLKEENLFDEVVMVTVSKERDMLEIQEEIAELLKLKFDERSMSARADKLRTRLMDTSRKIIIFDDVWKSLKLDDLGIPFESSFDRCKILLTTRVKGLCGGMRAQMVIEMGVLTKEEAWSLFKEKAGNYVEDSVLRPIAEEVAAECMGLPISLVTVGEALKDQSIFVWRDSLSQLKGSNPTDFPEVQNDVYKVLKLSYDYLDNESEKSLFLLCCLFPEDYNIPVEQLTFYSMGLRMFDGIRNIEEARNRTHRLVEKLKSRFLLMDGSDKHQVKMHDVVRDVAIFIGSKDNRGFLKTLEVTSRDTLRDNSSPDCNWVSMSISNEKIDLSMGLHFPNLRLLMMLKSTDKIVDISVEGMECLNVLSISEIVPSLPSSFGLLKNLRTLLLYRSTVRDITVIGELASLEILTCYRCYNIEELPVEIGRLNRLRLLELCDCNRLQKIAFGVISSLVELEELKILECFRRWEARENGKERGNAALTELESLPNLTCLQIEMSDCTLAAQEMRISQKLVKYCITSSYYNSSSRKMYHEKAMHLKLPMNITIGKWIHILARNAESLELEGDGSNNLNLAETENLKNLKFLDCSTVYNLINTVNCKRGTVFPLLEELVLVRLKNLQEICSGTIPERSSNSFQNLKKLSAHHLPELTHFWKVSNQNVALCNLIFVEINYCSNLRYLFSVSMVRSLSQLEVLIIKSCPAMVQLVSNELESITASSIEFPKLKSLKLVNLPCLTEFYKGVERMEFPRLASIQIEYLPRLNAEPHDDTSFHFLCNRKVEIGGLQRLVLYHMSCSIRNIWCQQIPINFFSNLEIIFLFLVIGIRNLMSSSIAKNLVSLRYLHLEFCPGMVEVIEKEEEEEGADMCVSLFPALENLHIKSLFELKSFGQCKQALELPSLGSVEIDGCPNMKTFTFGSLSTPNMKFLHINGQRIVDVKDLNVAMHHHFGLRAGARKRSRESEYYMIEDEDLDEDEQI